MYVLTFAAPLRNLIAGKFSTSQNNNIHCNRSNSNVQQNMIAKYCCRSLIMAVRPLTAADVIEMLDDPDEPVTSGSDDEDILWEEGTYCLLTYVGDMCQM